MKMTVKKLKQYLNDLDDDYEVVIRTMTKRSEEEIKISCYPYPYNFQEYRNIEFHDIGVSDKIIIFGIILEDIL